MPNAVTPDERADRANIYSLQRSEVVRLITNPPSHARRALLAEFGAKTRAPIESISVEFGNPPRLICVEVGASPIARSLYRVLTNTFRIPDYLLENIAVAHRIALPGDWVLRADADCHVRLCELARLVRDSGHPKFRLVPTAKVINTLVAHGTPRAPTSVLLLLRPLPGVDANQVRTGSFREFLAALSACLQRRVDDETTPTSPVVIAWQDNSFAYRQAATEVPATDVDAILRLLEEQLGIRLNEKESMETTWRLCDD